MKVKRKEQDIYTPLSWCDRMNSAYQMSIRNSVSAEAILDILTAPSTDSQQELQKRKNCIFSFLKPNAKVNTFLKGLPNSELFEMCIRDSFPYVWQLLFVGHYGKSNKDR